MKNLTQFKLLFIFFAVVAFLDIAYGANCYDFTSETGSCSGFYMRWTYSPIIRKCLWFVYGGCGATDNIFKTKQECKSACLPKDVAKKAKKG